MTQGYRSVRYPTNGVGTPLNRTKGSGAVRAIPYWRWSTVFAWAQWRSSW